MNDFAQFDFTDEPPENINMETEAPIRVLRSSTTEFAVGCRVLSPNIPVFGSFVKARVQKDIEVYGIIYNVLIEDDPLARELAGSSDVTEEYIEDQRQNRQVPIEVSVLVVGHRRAEHLYHYFPPQPPLTLNNIYLCDPAEVVAFTEQFDYFRTVLNRKEICPDEVLAASLRFAASCRDDMNERRQFMIRAGRELARLLNNDLVRLDGLLGQIRV